ncbi:MAG: hypothetical protein IJW80_07935, partial [Alistipes sp.]|nr:hypothetical protein [Alistipes sp.]
VRLITTKATRHDKIKKCFSNEQHPVEHCTKKNSQMPIVKHLHEVPPSATAPSRLCDITIDSRETQRKAPHALSST